MVEEILQWLKNISIFLIFMTTVLNLIPEKEDKKPVQFFLGIVMVLIFFQPVLKREVWSRKWRRRSTV